MGPVSGTSNCMCNSPLVWTYTSSTNSGVCICSDPLQIPSNNGTSCVCNPTYAITSTSVTCFDCRTVQYSTNTTINNSCGCQTNFVWNGNTQSCQCLPPDDINAGECVCDLNISVLIGSLCLDCQTIQFSLGPDSGASICLCPPALVWIFSF